jgi:arylsulfatase A
MRRRIVLLSLCLFSFMHAHVQTGHPNIVFILADDLGYGDVSSFNPQGKIATPNIDRMAKAGLRFTDAHSGSSVCTPTRYGLLTGRYSWRSTLKKGVLFDYSRPIIPSTRTTMAGMLKKQGYQTAVMGKWHLGWNWLTTDGLKPVDRADAFNLDFSRPLGGGPLDIGFDYFFGMDAPNLPPYVYIENRNTLGMPDTFYTTLPYNDCRPGRGIKGWDLKTIMGELQQRSVDYISRVSKQQQPFFLYLPITAPHTPIAPADQFRGKSGLNIYADFVMEVDGFVGAILDALERNGISENTILVFTSDNGCSPEANFAMLAGKGHDPSASFRGRKADLFEGGHRVPLLLQWPGRVKAGGTVRQTVLLNDFMASFAAITGYRLKDDEAEDSYDLSPLLFNPEHRKTVREASVHHSYFGDFAIRQGKWKLLLAPGSGGWSYPGTEKEIEGLPAVQLYDMEADPAEKENLQQRYPKKVKELQDLLNKYKSQGRSTAGKPQQNE